MIMTGKKRKWYSRASIGCAALLLFAGAVAAPAHDGKEIYMTHCASCHHPERYGLKAPSLIPETLNRYKQEELVRIIREGLPATQMPSFKEILNNADMESVITYMLTPVGNVQWGMAEINSSREEFDKSADAAKDRIYGLMREYGLEKSNENVKTTNIDLENITLVVESSRSVSVLNGQTFETLDRFNAGAIHGGPKFSHSLRCIYAPARDGVVTKYDLMNLKKTTSIKAGINLRNIAVSDDDRWIAVANYLPDNIVFLDADLRPHRIMETKGRLSGLYTLTSQKRFLASFRDTAELWFIDYTNNLEIRRVELPEPFEDISISPFEDIVIGASRKGTKMYVYNIAEEQTTASFDTDGMPHLASATYWGNDNGALFAAINHLKRPVLSILDLNDIKLIREIALTGAGFFTRTHQNTPYIWVDTNTDAIQLIDKAGLTIVKTLTPSKGKKAMHIEFTKDGRYALVSIYEEDGAIVIYDANTLAEIKRLPFRKPAGKYNALNKTFPGRGMTKRLVTYKSNHAHK